MGTKITEVITCDKCSAVIPSIRVALRAAVGNVTGVTFPFPGSIIADKPLCLGQMLAANAAVLPTS